MDRAGLVGEDGPTHHGSFDLSFLRCIPNLVIMAPADEAETQRLLVTGYQHPGPACVRYPRGKGPGAITVEDPQPVALGQSRTLRQGQRAALLNFGSLLAEARVAAEALDLTLIDMRFVKPLDQTRLSALLSEHSLWITLEENVIAGGAGSGVNEWLAAQEPTHPISILNLGLADGFIDHGDAGLLRAQAGLDTEGLISKIQQRLESRIGADNERA